ncbi:MAG: sodium/proline symporter PutP [Clostridia bacterium]|nr:sodium/proline symporter PutP [Clostridia bacterium]
MFNAELLAFILYFALIIGIGVYFFIRSKGGGDKEYFLGGRTNGPWVTAMSAQASDMSGWLLMGFPGSILAFGMGKVWIGLGLAIGTSLNWIFVAKRLRKFSAAANDSITLPQYLTNRFLTKSRALQIISALVFLVFFTLYVASSFAAGQKVFMKVFDGKISDSTALLIFAAIIIVYTFLGGFKAVCWTDFFQGLMMLVALLAVPFMIVAADEFDMAKVVAEYSYLPGTADAAASVFNANPFSASWQDIASGLAWGLGYFGMPHILVRFMGIKDAKMVKKSATVGIIWVVLSLGAAIALGILGRALYAEELLANGTQERIFIMATSLFPAFIGGLLLAAIIAAAMSTADSQLLVASSSFTSDIYKPVFRKNASNKEVIWVGRLVVLIIAVIAFFIARSKSETAGSIMGMVENAWGGFGAAFGPVIILSLFWKRLTYKGAIAGVVGGAVTDVVWLLFLSAKTGIYELLPGFIVGAICCIVVTLIDKKPSEDVEALFDRAVSEEV